VGLFATATPASPEGPLGLFYGGGFSLLWIQIVGVVAVGIWVAATSLAMFKTIKSTIGLRVSPSEEIEGLDLGEHGSEAYPDFIKQSYD